ncbi:MAG: hypothetical protein ACREHD_23035, partial [Pirellulales bacterium]
GHDGVYQPPGLGHVTSQTTDARNTWDCPQCNTLSTKAAWRSSLQSPFDHSSPGSIDFAAGAIQKCAPALSLSGIGDSCTVFGKHGPPQCVLLCYALYSHSFGHQPGKADFADGTHRKAGQMLQKFEG